MKLPAWMQNPTESLNMTFIRANPIALTITPADMIIVNINNMFNVFVLRISLIADCPFVFKLCNFVYRIDFLNFEIL